MRAMTTRQICGLLAVLFAVLAIAGVGVPFVLPIAVICAGLGHLL